MNTRFDSFISSIYNDYLVEDNNVQATNMNNLSTNIDPNTVKTFKDSVLVPMANKQNVDPNKMQEAIRAGIIEDHGDNVYTVSDAALAHANQDPELQGKFLPSQQAAEEIKRQKQQTAAAPTTPAVTAAGTSTPTQTPPPQNPTTSKTTSKPSTNRAGVVSSVYKMQ
jgi:hypothetical protein